MKENFSFTLCLAQLIYSFDYSNLITLAVFPDSKIHVKENYAISPHYLYIRISRLFPPKTLIYRCLSGLQKRVTVLLQKQSGNHFQTKPLDDEILRQKQCPSNQSVCEAQMLLLMCNALKHLILGTHHQLSLLSLADSLVLGEEAYERHSNNSNDNGNKDSITDLKYSKPMFFQGNSMVQCLRSYDLC